jgi:hypothetical protein
MDLLPRPLDPLRSIKVKLGVTLVGAGAAGIAVFSYGMGFFPPKTAATAIVVALVTSHGYGRPRATRSDSSPPRSTRWPPISPRPTSNGAS